MLSIFGLLGLAVGAFALAPIHHGRSDAEGEDDPWSDPRAHHHPDGTGEASGGDLMDGHDLAGGDDPVRDGTAGIDASTPPASGDLISGSRDDDVLFTGGGDDTVRGRDGDDYLDGEDGADRISGGDGGDDLQGGGGDDRVAGGAGTDAVYGHGGQDRLRGDAGDDSLAGGEGDDRLAGGDGDDLLAGNAGDDALTGGDGEDGMNGGDGDDDLSAVDGGRDWLNGGTGDDRLTGGADDHMNGGEGRDGFALSVADIQAADAADDAAAGPDAAGHQATIDDFDPAEDHLVVLYDPAGPPPALACEVTDAGATLFADGEAVAFLPGAVEIDLATVRLAPA